ncbi:MAG TPA: YncE family protein [Phycisphaerales bacterium]|nr:YncE family protein [Phycisphaerales bacterium]
MLARSVAAVLVMSAGMAFAQPVETVNTEGAPAHCTEIWDAPRPLPLPAPYASRLLAEFVDVNGVPDGDIPRDVAFTPDGTTAVIVNQGTGVANGLMTFLNVNTRTVTHSVEVEFFPNHVAVSPNGQYAVCSNVFSNSVSVVHIPTHTLLGNVPITGTQPFRVAITPDSQFAVVSVTNDAVNATFSVVSLSTLSEVRSFPGTSMGAIGAFATPEVGISSGLWSKWALTPDGTRIVVPDNIAPGRVVAFNVSDGAMVMNIPTAPGGRSIDIHPDGTTAVIGHEGNERKITKVDLVNGTATVLSGLTDSLEGQVIKITPDKQYAVAAISNNTVFHRLSDGVRTATVSTGIVGDLELSFDNQYIFVSNFTSRVISIASQSAVANLTFAACADAAISPTQLRAVALNNRFREDIHVYNINGAASSFEGFALSGPPPEGDSTRVVATSADGSVVVAGNLSSRNVTIIDGHTNATLGYVNTGDRVLDLAVTPNGQYAVVCNTDDGSGTVSIVDIASRTRVAHLSTPTRPGKVKISPDGSKAYVLSLAGTDTIYVINIAGAASSIAGTVLAGQTGNAQYAAYSDISGIELSPDGSILAVCVSFEDKIRLINTATRTIITDVEVGTIPGFATPEFPMRAVFSPDGTKLYTVLAGMNFSPTASKIAVVNINGAASAQVTAVPCNPYPLTMNIDPAGQFVYIGTNITNPGVQVFDTSSNSIVATIPTGGSVRAAALHDGMLYAAGLNNNTGGKLWRVSAAGAASSFIDETPLSGSPCEMAFNAATQTLWIAQPIPDALDKVSVGPECPGNQCGPQDYNGDGDSGTDQDIEAFFACLGGTCCDTCYCQGSDFNGDGDFGTDQDIEAFFRVLGGNPC